MALMYFRKTNRQTKFGITIEIGEKVLDRVWAGLQYTARRGTAGVWRDTRTIAVWGQLRSRRVLADNSKAYKSSADKSTAKTIFICMDELRYSNFF